MSDPTIEVEGLYDPDNGDLISVYAKGWVDPADFAASILFEFDVEVNPARVWHTYARKVPTWKWVDADYKSEKWECTGWMLDFAEEPGRGVFKVTYVDLWL